MSILAAIARTAARLCDAHDAQIYLVEGASLRLTAQHGSPRTARRRGERFPVNRDEVHGRAVLTRRVIRERTTLAAPLLAADTAVGVIVIRRQQVCPFTSQQITLLKTFAEQAVIAIENVRLARELEARNLDLSEALEQQTATADILRVISSSPTDLQPVLDAVVKSAARFCGADDASIFRLDGDSLRADAHHGPVPQPVSLRLPVARGTVGGRSVIERRPVHVADLQAEAEEFPEGSAAAKEVGNRTTLSVPLLLEGSAIGVIMLRRADVNLFTDKQIALLQTFADQAVIAIENVRLFTELQEKNRALTQAHGQVTEALEQQTATGEILRAIAHTQTDTQPVFDTIVKSAARLCRATIAALQLTDGRILYHKANYGSSPEALAAQLARYPRPLAMDSAPGVAILTSSLVHVPDIEEPATLEFVRETGRRHGFRSVAAVPMLREGEAIGAIIVTRREAGRFSDAELELLKTFADQAVIAVENVRLFTELQEKNRALTDALEQQTATGEVLRAISHSAMDAQPVFETIAESAVRLSGALFGSVYRFDGELIHMMAHHNYPPAALEFSRRFFPARPSPQSFTGRAIVRQAVVHVPDVSRDEERLEAQDLAEAIGFRSALAVPMLRDGAPIGAITVWRSDVGPFSDQHIALLQTFADQAVIAIQNERLFKELEARNRDLTEALDRQTATADILRAIGQAQTEVQPVFEAIADSAMRLLGAWTAAVTLYDGELVSLAAALGGLPGSADAFRQRGQMPHRPTAPPEQTVLTRRVAHVPDVETDPSCSFEFRRHAAERGFRSFVSVPMLRGPEPLGMITVTRAQPGGFSAAEIALLQTFADQAVIAVENARLLTALQARTADLTRSVDQLTALGEVGRAVSSTLDLETVLTTIVSRAVQLSGLDGGVVFEYDEDGQQFVNRAQAETGGALAATRRATRIRKGEGVIGRTAITLEPVQVADITVPGAYAGPNLENLIASGIRALVAVPMVREGRVIGCLGVSRDRPGAFPPETIELLRTFATQSALAIQNARLFHEIEDKSRQLEAASRHKSEFLANMSHELRTPLNAVIGFSEVLLQRMFGALTDKQDEYLKDIYASGQHLLSLINDILDLSKIEAGRMELTPAPFHLPGALDNAVTLVKERAARHGIALELDIDPGLGELVGDERKVKQVVLNLLSNAVKFTPEGGRIRLTAARRDGAVEIAVADTGVGIAPEDQTAIFEEFRQVGADEGKREGTGLGLALARKFVELHGGRLRVESAPGAGSTFTFTLPADSPESR